MIEQNEKAFAFAKEICKDFAEMNYSEFLQWLDEHDGNEGVEFPLSYDEWAVVKIDNRYFYYNYPIEASGEDFYEVELVATLYYDINNDLKIKTDEEMSQLFDCDICGEQVYDDRMTYYWFKEKSIK